MTIVQDLSGEKAVSLSGDQRLDRRWTQASGAGEETARVVRDALDRVRRYPTLVRVGYPLVPFLIEWLGPLLALGQLRRASGLPDGAFEALQHRLCGHRWLVVRTMFMLFRVPLSEQLEREAPPPPVPHPLAAWSDGQAAAGSSGTLAAYPGAESEFDVVVVGSGAGGAPVAWSLAGKGFRVAVVEAGSLPEPATSARAMERLYLKQGFVVSMAGGLIPVMAAQAVGGTTAINSGTCLRPPRDRLEAWDRDTGTDLSAGALEPYLDAAEQVLRVTVPDRALLGVSNRLIEAGLHRLGRPGTYVLPRNAPTCEGSGRCCFVCPTGAKRSTDRSFLPEAIALGCHFLIETRATRIREDHDHVEVAVEGLAGRRILRCRHLVLAAGAFGTPGLLRQNRLGDRWRRAGHDLKIHPASKVFAHFPRVLDGEKGVPQGLGYHDPANPRINFEGIFTPAGIAARIIPLAGKQLQWWLDRYDHVASFGLTVQDRAAGRVFFAGSHPQIWYRLDPQDASDLGEGMLLVARAFFAAGADRVLLPVSGIPNEFDSLDALDRLRPADFEPGSLMCAGFHPQGTAGIGRVVDRDLRVLGTSRIWVADASVLPDSPRVNPQITIMALSLRLADHLAEALERQGRSMPIRRARCSGRSAGPPARPGSS